VDKVEFGALIPFARLADVPQFARKVEQLGYDYLACGEHVMFRGPITNSLICLSVAAGATERIKLMSSVVLLPLYQPVLLAKLTSVLDVASGGRYHMGVGVGGEFPDEFAACGVPVRERGARANEALELIRRLWTEDCVSFEGRYNRTTGITLAPKPAQKPHPPIWVAGRKEAAMRRAALYGDGWLPYMYTPAMVRQSIETIAEFRAARGRSMTDFRVGLFIFVCIMANRDEARAQAIQTLSRNYGQDFSKLVDKYVLYGTADDCRRRLEEFVNAGARTVIFAWACHPKAVEENLVRLAEAVIPAFR